MKILEFLEDPKKVTEGESKNIVEEVTPLHSELDKKFKELHSSVSKIQFTPEVLKASNILSNQCEHVKTKAMIPFYADNLSNLNIKKIAVKMMLEKNSFNIQREILKMFEKVLKGETDEKLNKGEPEAKKREKPKSEI